MLQTQCISQVYLGKQKVSQDFFKKRPIKKVVFLHGENFDRNIFQQLKNQQIFLN